MPKTKISEFSATPASNTDIDSINIAEGCAPSGINDAIRELMAQLKDWQSGTSNDPMVIGSSGSLTLSQGTANGVTYLNGSKVVTSGTALVFDGTNLGVGTSSPSALLDIQGATGVIRNTATTGTNQVYTRQGNTGGFFYTGLDTSAGGFLTGSAYAGFLWMSGAYPMIFGTSNAERARIDSSGNLGVGVTSITGGYKAQINGNLLLGTAANPLLVGTTSLNLLGDNSSSSGMRLDSSGNLLVGTTSSVLSNTNSQVLASTNGYVVLNHASGTGSGTKYVYFGYNATEIGSITQSGTTAVLYNTTSDQRLKENIQDADSSSSLIDALQVRKFDWKTDQTHQRYGFIAQELVQVVPEAVHQPLDTEQMMAVDYSKLVPMLVKEIQSLRKRLADANL